MLGFVIRRALLMIPMVFLFSVVAFLIILAPPGDYLSEFAAQLAEETGMELEEEMLEYLRERYGLGDPIYVQYAKWMAGVVRWDFGRSLEYKRPVSELLNERLAMTILLTTFTVMFTWTLAIPIGILSAVRQYSVLDYFFTFTSYVGVGTPNFVLALLLMYLAFDWFDLNVTGLFSQEYFDAPWSVGRIIDMLKHLWLPMVILGTDGMAGLTRVVRANLLDELSKPYVETARAKGLAEWKVILKYPSRIAINPFISTAGWALPQLFSGSLIVATVMSLPTVGPLLLRALWSQDMYMAGSILFILTALTLLGTLISDILLGWLDPRIRLAM